MIFISQDLPGLSSSDQEGLKVAGLFGNPIQVSQGDDVYKFEEEELFLLKNVEFKDNFKNLISSSFYILDDLKLNNIKEYIQNYLNFYIRNILMLSEDIKIKITTSWVNKTLKNQGHHSHSHTNSIISGILTLTKNNKICFNDTNSAIHLFAKTLSLSSDDILSSTIQCQFQSVGSLILFPSSLNHHVPKYDGQEPRYSLSFNTIIYGKIGQGVDELVLP